MKGFIKKKNMGKQWNKVRQINNIFGELCVELGIWKKKKTWRRSLKIWGNLLQEVIQYEWLSIKVERGDKQQMRESILWRNYKMGKNINEVL